MTSTTVSLSDPFNEKWFDVKIASGETRGVEPILRNSFKDVRHTAIIANFGCALDEDAND